MKLFGSDAAQTMYDVVGDDSDEDSDQEIGEDAGDAEDHSSGGAVKVSDALHPQEKIEGETTVATADSDPLFFVKLSEARGKVFTS